jgi:hypothetical protein
VENSEVAAEAAGGKLLQIQAAIQVWSPAQFAVSERSLGCWPRRMSREHGTRMKEERSPKRMRKSARERLDGREVGGRDAWAASAECRARRRPIDDRHELQTLLAGHPRQRS